MQVEHVEYAQRFLLEQDGVRCVLDYERDGAVIIITHTHVPAAVAGRGIAGALTRTALEYARASGYKVVPHCSYATRYIERHPEYASLLVGR